MSSTWLQFKLWNIPLILLNGGLPGAAQTSIEFPGNIPVTSASIQSSRAFLLAAALIPTFKDKTENKHPERVLHSALYSAVRGAVQLD